MEVSGQLQAPGIIPVIKPSIPIGLRAFLDAVTKRKIPSLHYWESNNCHPACSLVTILIQLPGFKAYIAEQN
jgi:hypothetical protein